MDFLSPLIDEISFQRAWHIVDKVPKELCDVPNDETVSECVHVGPMRDLLCPEGIVLSKSSTKQISKFQECYVNFLLNKECEHI